MSAIRAGTPAALGHELVRFGDQAGLGLPVRRVAAGADHRHTPLVSASRALARYDAHVLGALLLQAVLLAAGL